MPTAKALKTDNSYLSRVTQNPLLLSADSEQVFLHSMRDLAACPDYAKMQTADARPMAASVSDDDDFWAEDQWYSSYRPYNVVNGTLMIPVSGVLLNRFSFQVGRWATGYQYIERAFNRGMDDSEVVRIAFIVDSPGGEVAGNFELVEKVAARRGEKPIWAFASDHAYSAAYSLASAADVITMSRSGGVGSIGVVVAHMEFSDALKKMGVKVTFIFAGAHKVDGNPYEKLPDAVKDRIQERIDRIYGEFTGLVAANRGMDESAVRDTEALTFDASNALEVGLADRVGAIEEEMVIFSEEAEEPENELMATTPKTPAATDGQFTQAQMDEAVAAAKAEGRTEGETAERERMNEIMGCEEAKERPVAAKALLEAGMDAATAKTTLAKMPKETVATTEEPKPAADAGEEPKPAAGTDGFAKAMAATGNPEVGAEAEAEGGEGDPDASKSAELLGALAMATGKKRKVTAQATN